MKANAPVDEEPLGKVTLEYFTNGKEHKWGTSFYGTRDNLIYLKEMQFVLTL